MHYIYNMKCKDVGIKTCLPVIVCSRIVHSRDCGNNNFSWRDECNRCKTAKPEGADGGGGGKFINLLWCLSVNLSVSNNLSGDFF